MYDRTQTHVAVGFSQLPGVPSDPVTPRRPEVAEHFDILAKSLDVAAARLEALEQKLQPVFRDSARADQSGKAAAPESVLVPVAHGIREAWRKVDRLSERIDALFQGLEI
jgi:hypothetical protein